MSIFTYNDKLNTSGIKPEYKEQSKSSFNYYFLEEDKYKFIYNKEYNADFHCVGYINYLKTCWYKDLGIEISPAYVWNTILWQICVTVNKYPDSYRDLFTRSTDKIDITIDITDFDPNVFFDALDKYVPINMDLWIPKFGYEPTNYTGCMKAIFCETASPYYIYATILCGTPKIRLIGDKDEWMKIYNTLAEINKLSDRVIQTKTTKNYISSFPEYINKCMLKILEFIDNLDNAEYWKKFFYIDTCGCGEPYYYGRIFDFVYRESENKIPNIVGRCPFVNMNVQLDIAKKVSEQIPDCYDSEIHGVKCKYISGIFYAKIDNEHIAIPQYDSNVLFPLIK